MATIREVCFDDILELTHMTMGQTVMGPLSDFMSNMAKFPKYSLVCVSPGNRITGFISGYNVGDGVERHCAINEMHYLREDMVHRLLKEIEERAVTNRRKVYHVEADIISDNEKSVELLEEIGYTCHKEYFDVIDGALVNKKKLGKDLSGVALYCNSLQYCDENAGGTVTFGLPFENKIIVTSDSQLSTINKDGTVSICYKRVAGVTQEKVGKKIWFCDQFVIGFSGLYHPAVAKCKELIKLAKTELLTREFLKHQLLKHAQATYKTGDPETQTSFILVVPVAGKSGEPTLGMSQISRYGAFDIESGIACIGSGEKEATAYLKQQNFCIGKTFTEAINTTQDAVRYSSMHHVTVGGKVQVFVAHLLHEGKLLQPNILEYQGMKNVMRQLITKDNLRKGILIDYWWYKQFVYPYWRRDDADHYLSGRRRIPVRVYPDITMYTFTCTKLDLSGTAMQRLGIVERAYQTIVLGETDIDDYSWRNLVSRFGLTVGCTIVIYWDVEAATLVLGVVREQGQ